MIKSLLLTIGAFCVFGCASTPAVALAARPTNVVFILADDLGYGDLGCYGSQKILTPNIDRLATEGMRFTQFYSGAPVCAPARCVLMTGKHTGHACIRANSEIQPEGQGPMAAEEVTVAELLRQRGYTTGAFGKWGLGFVGTEGDPNAQGFDVFFGYNCQRQAHFFYPTHLWHNDKKVVLEGNNIRTGEHYSHDLIADQTLRFIRDNKDRPFFCYVPFTIPHLALQVPDESLAQYKGKFPETPYDGEKGYSPHPTPRAAYAAMISHMDRDVGRILNLLKELGIDDRTLVIFTSDNGGTHDVGGADTPFFKSNGDLRATKGYVYEGGIRVPFVARWPGTVKPGRVVEAPFAFWDVLPTMLEIAGESPSGQLDGVSFLPALTGKGAVRPREFLYWEFPGYGGQQAVRMGKWKGVRVNLLKGGRQNSDGGHLAPIELYDLETDPGETTDVAADHPQIVAKIEKIMATSRVPSDRFRFPPLDRLSQHQ